MRRAPTSASALTPHGPQYLASVHGGTLEEDMTAAETMHPFATHKAEPAGGHSASNAGDSSHAYFRQ